MTHLDNCAISATSPPPTTTLPSLKEMELCAQSVITVWASRFGSGYLIWLLVCLGTFMRQQGSGPLALPSSHFNKSATNTWPVDGRWGALLETAVLTDGDRDEWQWQGRLQCHLTDQTVWRPGPLKCDAESTWRGPSDIKRKKKKKGRRGAKMILKFFLSHRIKLILSWALSRRINAGADLRLTLPLIWAALNNGVTIWHKCAFKCKS